MKKHILLLVLLASLASVIFSGCIIRTHDRDYRYGRRYHHHHDYDYGYRRY